MSHHRAAIREAVVALLIATATAAQGRVFDTPTDPRTEFPALTVEDLGERQEMATYKRGGTGSVRRSLMLEVTAEVQQNQSYARQRDALLGQVEAAMAVVSLPGVSMIVPAGYSTEIITGAQRPIAIGRQRFELTYITTQVAPGAALPA